MGTDTCGMDMEIYTALGSNSSNFFHGNSLAVHPTGTENQTFRGSKTITLSDILQVSIKRHIHAEVTTWNTFALNRSSKVMKTLLDH